MGFILFILVVFLLGYYCLQPFFNYDKTRREKNG